MRRAWPILLGAALSVTVLAQDQQPPAGIVIRDFSITDTLCGYKHDGAVEKALQTVRVVPNTGKPTAAQPVATLELRNNSAKTVTAYVLNYTFTHGGKTEYHDGYATDLVYEMAISKGSREQAPPNSTFPPGGVIKQDIHGRRGHGHFEVYPCMVAFDDGSFIGPPFLAKLVMRMRADNAKALGALIADLRVARDSPDPKTFLTNRAKQTKRTSKGRGDEEPYRYLEIVASALSSSGDSSLDRKTINEHVSALEAEREMLLKQSSFRIAE